LFKETSNLDFLFKKRNNSTTLKKLQIDKKMPSSNKKTDLKDEEYSHLYLNLLNKVKSSITFSSKTSVSKKGAQLSNLGESFIKSKKSKKNNRKNDF
jgi:hypothetical protein